jgi:hypothetical protein
VEDQDTKVKRGSPLDKEIWQLEGANKLIGFKLKKASLPADKRTEFENTINTNKLRIAELTERRDKLQEQWRDVDEELARQRRARRLGY